MEKVLDKVKKNKSTEGNIFVENYNKRIRQEGIEEGIEKGIEQGIELEKINNIKILLKNNILNEVEIANLFNVTLEYVLKIKNSL